MAVCVSTSFLLRPATLQPSRNRCGMAHYYERLPGGFLDVLAFFGRQSRSDLPMPTPRCKPDQACITSALTKAHDEEGPCPKCKTSVVGLHGLTPVGSGGRSSSSSGSGVGGSSGSGYGAKQKPREGSGENRALCVVHPHNSVPGITLLIVAPL